MAFTKIITYNLKDLIIQIAYLQGLQKLTNANFSLYPHSLTLVEKQSAEKLINS
jgi:hypothetical protein